MKQPRLRVANRIKRHIRQAKTIAEVNAVVTAHARAWRALKNSRRPIDRTMATQIENLASYRRMCIRMGWNG